MTAIVGILCKRGVVIGSDSSATSSNGMINTIEQTTKKISIIEGKYIFTSSGSVGLSQRFFDKVKSLAPRNTSLGHLDLCRLISESVTKDFISTNVPRGQFGYNSGFGISALFAFSNKSNEHFLFEFDTSIQPEMKTDQLWFASIGSGQITTDPFLGFIKRMFYKCEKPDIQDGIFAAIWALQHIIDLNTGGINGPINIAILECDKKNSKARELSPEEIQEHSNHIEEFESKISEIKKEFFDGDQLPSNIPNPE